MSVFEFKRRYFHGWTVAEVTTFGTDCGYIKLRFNDTVIKVFFNLNGAHRYTDECVTVDHVEGCSGSIF